MMGEMPQTRVARGRASSLPPALALLRPQQWVKNAFVVAPLFFTPSALVGPLILRVLLGVLSFCALASCVYIINDYMDRSADRQHPEKRFRPLAAGTVPVSLAFAELLVLGAGGLGIGFYLSTAFGEIALLYLAVNLLYSLKLKRMSIIDVMLVALGYVLRVYAGAEAIGVPATVWIIVCTGLVSLFIALAKRRDDLVRNLDAGHRTALKGYTKPFIDACLSIVLSGLVVSYLIYTTEQDVMIRLGSTKLYLTTPFVIMGVLRYLQIALVEERSGSPTTLVLTDRFLILCVVGWALAFGALIYG